MASTRPEFKEEEARMSLSFCVLGSGSAGNSTLLICNADASDRHCMLIDAGLSPRMTARRMHTLGIAADEIRAIILTHLDSDHFHAGWLNVIERRGIALHVHHRHRNAAWQCGVSMRHASLFTEQVACEDGPSFSSLLCAHDNLGSVGFVVGHAGLRLGFVTDLGRVPEILFERFVDLDALAIESNYDRSMQAASARPAFLKHRIMGGMGHLSNEQALEAILRLETRNDLGQIVLLHLSRQCNDPDLVRRLYARRAPHLADRLVISSQLEPTPVVRVQKHTGLQRQGVIRGFTPLLPFETALPRSNLATGLSNSGLADMERLVDSEVVTPTHL
jgi:phosphoribosyl 1,2-cyclic phosphodiesterase